LEAASLDRVHDDYPEARARVLIAEAADGLWTVVHPGDEIGRASADAPVLDPIVQDLNEVENLLARGIGRANTAEGLPKLVDVIRRIESALTSREGSPVSLSADARAALSRALDLLRQIDFPAMTAETEVAVVATAPLPKQAEAVAEKLADATYSLQWHRLTEDGAWTLFVFNEEGEFVDISAAFDPEEALLAVAERLLP
jgi:hypothetical protein